MSKKILAIAVMLCLSGCATTNSKFSFSDRASRVMFDTKGIPDGQLALIQEALLNGDRFVLVERADSKAEQESLDRLAAGDKKAKWALWASKYEIGGVITARVQCFNKDRFLGGKKTYCHQYLAIMHAQTGAVIVSSEGENSESADAGHPPDWEGVAGKLASNFDQLKSRIVFHADKPIRAVASEPAVAPSAAVVPSAPAVKAAPPAPAAAAPEAETPDSPETPESGTK